MENTKAWFQEQWKNRKFRILFVISLLVTIVLGIEFVCFQYSILKIIRYLILSMGLFFIAWIDGNSKRIPNQSLITLFILRTIVLLIECIVYKEMWMSFIISFASGFIIAGGMFLLCYLLTRGAVGAGDVKLFAVLGYFLGNGAVFTVVFVTVLLAAGYSTVRLILKKTGMKEEIPFAPFIFIGTVVSMALGI